MRLRHLGLALTLELSLASLVSATGHAQIVDVTVRLPPPPLPIYVQPPIPAPDYLWTPGYWSWDPAFGYFWVPGTWVLAPRPGLLWTPGYWGYANDVYGFHTGYWADRVGFYGGVAYGYGYTGEGYDGGRWDGNQFSYNRTVNNITNVNITHVYSQTVVDRTANGTVSFNGGPGGTAARPSIDESRLAATAHVPPTAAQMQHVTAASRDVGLRASQNNGKPTVAATQKAAEFNGPGVVPATAAGRAPATSGPAAVPVTKPAPSPDAPRNATAVRGQSEARPLPAAGAHGDGNAPKAAPVDHRARAAAPRAAARPEAARAPAQPRPQAAPTRPAAPPPERTIPRPQAARPAPGPRPVPTGAPPPKRAPAGKPPGTPPKP